MNSQTQEEQEEVMFLCEKYPSMEVVLQPGQTMLIDGKPIKVPMKLAGFIRGPFGGQLKTKDPEVIKKIESLPEFNDGIIWMVKDPSKLIPKPAEDKVVTGGLSSRPAAPKQPDPSPRPVPAAASFPDLTKPPEEPAQEPEQPPAAPAAVLTPPAQSEGALKPKVKL